MRDTFTPVKMFAYAVCSRGGYMGALNNPYFIRAQAVYDLWDGEKDDDLNNAADFFVSFLEAKYHGMGFDYMPDRVPASYGDIVYATNNEDIIIDLIYEKDMKQSMVYSKRDLFGQEYSEASFADIIEEFSEKNRTAELFIKIMPRHDFYLYNTMTRTWIAINAHGSLDEPKITLPASVEVTRRKAAVVLEYDNGWVITLTTRKNDRIKVTWKKK